MTRGLSGSVAPRACPRDTVTRSRSRTSRSVTGPRRCWCGCAATGAATAAAPGGRTRRTRRRRGRRSPAAGSGGHSAAIVVDHLTVSRAAAGLGVSWHTANTAILAEGKQRLIDESGEVRRGHHDRCRRARLASHTVWREVRDRDHRPRPCEEQDRARPPAAGHGRGPLEAGVQAVATPPGPRSGRSRSKWSRWMGSVGSRPPRPKSSPTRSR